MQRKDRWRWLKAGVLEDGQWREQEEGTPQGGSISPLAANIYLHYVLALWAERWRREPRGELIIGRFADDVIVGFEHQNDAERRQRRRQGKPETFDFLGFTHLCSKTRKGTFTVRRKTIAKRLRQKLQDIKVALRERMHWPIPQRGAWVRRVLLGHYRYSAVPRNGSLRKVFRETIRRYWCGTRHRRSQRHRRTSQRMYALAEQWLPKPHSLHPYPAHCLHVTTRGRSPVR